MEPIVTIPLRDYESLKEQIENYKKLSSGLVIRHSNDRYYQYVFITKEGFNSEVIEKNKELSSEISQLKSKMTTLEKKRPKKSFWNIFKL